MEQRLEAEAVKQTDEAQESEQAFGSGIGGSRDAKAKKKRAKRVSKLTTRRKKTPVDKLRLMASRPVPMIHVSDDNSQSAAGVGLS